MVGLGQPWSSWATPWLPILRQQPLITGLVPAVGWVCCTQSASGCHQTCDWIGLQGAGPCCVAGSFYSLFWHSWRWRVWTICHSQTLVAAAGAVPGIPGPWASEARPTWSWRFLQPKDLGFPHQHLSWLSAMRPWCSFLKWEPSGDGARELIICLLGGRVLSCILIIFCINAASALHWPCQGERLQSRWRLQ